MRRRVPRMSLPVNKVEELFSTIASGLRVRRFQGTLFTGEVACFVGGKIDIDEAANAFLGRGNR